MYLAPPPQTKSPKWLWDHAGGWIVRRREKERKRKKRRKEEKKERRRKGEKIHKIKSNTFKHFFALHSVPLALSLSLASLCFWYIWLCWTKYQVRVYSMLENILKYCEEDVLYDKFTIEQLSFCRYCIVYILLWSKYHFLKYISSWFHGILLILSSQSSILLNQLSCSTPIIVAKWLIVMYVQAKIYPPISLILVIPLTILTPNTSHISSIYYHMYHIWGRIVVELRCAHYVRVGGW